MTTTTPAKVNWCIDGWMNNRYDSHAQRVFVRAATREAALAECGKAWPNLIASSIAPEGHPELRVEISSMNPVVFK